MTYTALEKPDFILDSDTERIKLFKKIGHLSSKQAKDALVHLLGYDGAIERIEEALNYAGVKNTKEDDD